MSTDSQSSPRARRAAQLTGELEALRERLGVEAAPVRAVAPAPARVPAPAPADAPAPAPAPAEDEDDEAPPAAMRPDALRGVLSRLT